MIFRAKNDKAVLSFLWRGKTKNVNIPKLSVVDLNEEKKVVVIRNMWSGAHEKYIAGSDATRIQLEDRHVDKLINSPHFRVLENWKPCM